MMKKSIVFIFDKLILDYLKEENQKQTQNVLCIYNVYNIVTTPNKRKSKKDTSESKLSIIMCLCLLHTR